MSQEDSSAARYNQEWLPSLGNYDKLGEFVFVRVLFDSVAGLSNLWHQAVKGVAAPCSVYEHVPQYFNDSRPCFNGELPSNSNSENVKMISCIQGINKAKSATGNGIYARICLCHGPFGLMHGHWLEMFMLNDSKASGLGNSRDS